MEVLAVLLAVALALSEWVVAARGPHHPHASHYRPSPGSPKITKDPALLHDTGHIQEDLGKMNIDLDKMTPEELEFHYFKIHDYDNNTKLDGLEILQAIRHTVEHTHSEDITRDPKKPRLLPTQEDFSYFVELIDQVLEEDDQDQDGYLSYTEYVVGRQRDSSKKKP